MKWNQCGSVAVACDDGANIDHYEIWFCLTLFSWFFFFYRQIAAMLALTYFYPFSQSAIQRRSIQNGNESNGKSNKKCGRQRLKCKEKIDQRCLEDIQRKYFSPFSGIHHKNHLWWQNLVFSVVFRFHIGIFPREKKAKQKMSIAFSICSQMFVICFRWSLIRVQESFQSKCKFRVVVVVVDSVCWVVCHSPTSLRMPFCCIKFHFYDSFKSMARNAICNARVKSIGARLTNIASRMGEIAINMIAFGARERKCQNCQRSGTYYSPWSKLCSDYILKQHCEQNKYCKKQNVVWFPFQYTTFIYKQSFNIFLHSIDNGGNVAHGPCSRMTSQLVEPPPPTLE